MDCYSPLTKARNDYHSAVKNPVVRLQEAKRNTLEQQDLHPFLKLVLEIDGLPERARFARLEELTAELRPGFLHGPVHTKTQLVAAVRVAIGWVDGVSATRVSDAEAGLIIKFQGAVMGAVGPHISPAERDSLLTYVEWRSLSFVFLYR